MDTRNLIGIYITRELIDDTLKGKTYFVVEPIPGDAELFSMDWIPSRAAYFLVYSHPSFPKVYDGDPIQIIAPHFEKYFKKGDL